MTVISYRTENKIKIKKISKIKGLNPTLRLFWTTRKTERENSCAVKRGRQKGRDKRGRCRKGWWQTGWTV